MVSVTVFSPSNLPVYSPKPPQENPFERKRLTCDAKVDIAAFQAIIRGTWDRDVRFALFKKFYAFPNPIEPQVATAVLEKINNGKRLTCDVEVNIAAESAFSLIEPDKNSSNLSGISQVFHCATEDLAPDQIKVFCRAFFKKLKLNQGSFFQAITRRTQDRDVWFAIFRGFYAFSNRIEPQVAAAVLEKINNFKDLHRSISNPTSIGLNKV